MADTLGSFRVLSNKAFTLLLLFNIVVPSILFALICGQAVYVALYLRQRKAVTWQSDEFFPKAAVILCLRGRDPTLSNCLDAVLALDYPCFELHTVFDSDLDPALPLVSAIKQHSKVPIHVHFIGKPSGQCGMKCEALRSAIQELDSSIEVIALVDADSIVAKNWLTEIVRPLQDNQVGVVTGDRWFEPRSNFASITRAIWSAAAIVQMNLYQIPWGGSLAIRRETIQELNLLKIWGTTFCEDTVLTEICRRNGLSIVRPRQIVVINRETIAWRDLHYWIARQLLTVRLHNPKWALVLGHGILVGLTLLSCFLLFGVNLAINQLTSALLVISATACCELLNFLLLVWVARENIEVLKNNQQLANQAAIYQHWFAWVVSTPLTQLVHFASTMRSLTLRHVIWRGIEYRVSKSGVQLLNYRPFLDRNQPDRETESVS